MKLPTLPFRPTGKSLGLLAELVWRYRRILKATTEVELRKKFAGSALGSAWIVLHPLLFLLIYLFLFLVVFKVKFPGMSDLGFAVYVFTGLVPFLAVMDGSLSAHVIWLPVAVALQLAFVLGLVLVISALGVMLPDLGYGLNLVMIFLMFVSPIGFKPDALPASAQPLVWLNPIHYMLETFRSSLIAGHGPNWPAIIVFALLAGVSLVGGAGFFRRFKGIIVDYE
jgi:lipopolysaccharide transport system permease protein